jgi:DNA-binding NtrC family response regulator
VRAQIRWLYFDFSMTKARDIILIMEDDPWVADYVADVVTAFFATFRILKAVSAEDARKVFYANCDEIAVIVSDLSLGAGDGKTVVSEMAGGCHEIGIVFVTGHVENERELSRMVGRTVSLVFKPFGPVDLKVAIETRLSSSVGKVLAQTEI